MKTDVMKGPFDERKTRRFLLRLALFAVLLLALLVVNALSGGNQRGGDLLDMTDSAVCHVTRIDGSVSREDLTKARIFQGDRITIEVPIPVALREDQVVLAFTTANVYEKVSFDGQVLMTYGPDRVSRDHHFGAIVKRVEIPRAALGKSLVIEEEALSDNARPLLGPVFILPSKESFTYFLHGDDLIFIVYHALLFISIIAILALLAMEKSPAVKRGIALFLFVGSFTLWNLGYHHMLSFWISDDYVNTLLEYGSLYFLPAPFLYYLYLMETDNHRRRVYGVGTCWFSFLFIAVCLLQEKGILTMDRVLPVLHISIIAAALLVCLYQFHPKRKLDLPVYIVRYGVLASAGAAVIDTAQFYIYGQQDPRVIRMVQALANWALLVFVLSIALAFLFRIFMQAMEAREKEVALHMAYHDALTGLWNHGGIFKAAKELTPDDRYGILFADLNGLKETNDLYGHLAGDHFIKAMGRIMEEAAGPEGICGRVGGDEFILILKGDDAIRLPEVALEIQKKLGDLKGKKEMPANPSASIGMCFNDPRYPASFEEHLKEADDRMYAEKAAYKKINPSEERRDFRRGEER